MYLEILTPDTKVFEGEVEAVQLPGKKGLFEVLTGHAPIISDLEEGKIRIKTSNDEQIINIDGGVVEVLENKIVVLVEAVLEKG